MAELDIFNIPYNDLKNSKGGRISHQRDSIIRDNNFTELSNVVANHDRPDFLSGKKTYNAIVVYDYGKNALVAGTETTSLLQSFGDVSADNILQVRAVIPDAHDLITPMPFDIGKQGLKSAEQQKYLKLAPIFQSIGNLNGSVTPGSIIEVEFTDGEYSEGKIISIVKTAGSFEAAVQSAKNAFENASNEISNLFDSGIQTGDGSNSTDLSTLASGQCGGVGSYAQQDCYNASLTSTGQSVTLHEQFWNQLNDLVTQIFNETGERIKIKNSTRSTSTQISLRKGKCPEWSLLLDSMTEEQIMSMSWNKMNNAIKAKNGTGCSEQTPVGAAYGSSTSNHLKGLAVDLTMDIRCPAKTNDKSGWQNCKDKSNIFKIMEKYASSYGIKNYDVEPWHWSWNGS